MAWHNDLGKEGEQRAVDYLLSQGYRVLERNWRAPHSRHELDIIAMRDETVVIVEVKTRSSYDFGEPLDAIDAKKMKALALAADSYMNAQRIDLPLRFDLIGIVNNDVVHIKSAFVPQAKFH